MIENNSSRFPSFDRKDILLVAGIFLCVLALFGPATGYEFVGLDDEPYVSHNPMTRDGFSGQSLKWSWTSSVVGHWAPVLWMSYMLDGEVFGPGPGGFHFTNILLHAINAVLVFCLLRSWTGYRWAACWGALFWALHPLRVESAAWITERKDVLSGLFFLLCLLAYTRSRQDGKCLRRWHWGAAGLLCAGLMVKPVLITVPFILCMLDIWPLRRSALTVKDLCRTLPKLLMEKWPFWLLALALGIISWCVNRAAGIPRMHMPPLGERLLLIPGNYLVYLQQTLWPGMLSVLYPRPVFSPWIFTLAILVLAGVFSAAWIDRNRHTGVVVGWLWFLGMLVPSIGIVWMGTTEGAGDRFTYLPAIGLSLMIAAWAGGRKKGRTILVLAGVLSVLAAALLTTRQLPVWKNSGTLFGRVLEVAPNHLQANLNYGIWLWEQGDEPEARHYFRRAFECSSQGPQTVGDAAYSYALGGDSRLAQAILEPSLPDHRATPLMHGAYGMSCLYIGDASGAIRHLEQALSMSSGNQELRIELIRACFEAGEKIKALNHVSLLDAWPGGEIRTLLDLFPFYVQRWREGSRQYAWTYFAHLVRQEPQSVPLLNNLAWLAVTDSESPPDIVATAFEFARQAVEITGGSNAVVLDTLSVALARSGDYQRALETGRKARRLANREGNKVLADNIARRLKSYQSKRPWLEHSGQP